ncbi:serine/threonine protein kinase [Leptospira kobayashii]|uniref:Serine/threonine protein kinase n=1 Tax=Leptospira kobayashii TaxID=1917830 RepID=A0ABN6K8K9_9LEPT|nr:aminoglycoside phosphotransferase family protein [Leptospira kobayashii]BDA77138.1 serine/threonine protein kinase [Leptospira kobayashii]
MTNILSNEITDYLDSLYRGKYETLPLQEEASTRRYFLIKTNNAKEVLCVDQKLNHDFIEITKFLRSNQIRTPEVIRTNEQLNLTFISWEGKNDLSSLSPEQYKKRLPEVLDLILKLQTLEPLQIVAERRFDLEKLMFEINLTIEKFHKMKTMYSLETEITDEAKYFLEETAGYLDKHPVNVFTHRDFHCRNILLNEENGLTLIDFQDARMGIPQYDLVSLIYDAYYPLTKEYRSELIDYFRKRTIGSDKKFKESLYLQALQRSFKALGTYFRMVADEKKMKFKPSILSCLQQLEEIIQIGMFADSLYVFIRSLRNELAKHPEFKSLPNFI